jgi:hypothetical protein
MFSPIHQLVPPYRVNVALWPAHARSFLGFYATRPFGTFRPRITERRGTPGSDTREHWKRFSSLRHIGIAVAHP